MVVQVLGMEIQQILIPLHLDLQMVIVIADAGVMEMRVVRMTRYRMRIRVGLSLRPLGKGVMHLVDV